MEERIQSGFNHSRSITNMVASRMRYYGQRDRPTKSYSPTILDLEPTSDIVDVDGRSDFQMSLSVNRWKVLGEVCI